MGSGTVGTLDNPAWKARLEVAEQLAKSSLGGYYSIQESEAAHPKTDAVDREQPWSAPPFTNRRGGNRSILAVEAER